MDINEYQFLARRTINTGISTSAQNAHALHGMVGEIGELHSIYQKTYQGHEFDENHAKKEVGDLLWFIAEFCTSMGWSMNDVAVDNIKKLINRYPEGFDEERSLLRDENDI